MNKKLQGFLELIKASKKAQLILACSVFVTVAGATYGVSLLGNKTEMESNKNVSSIIQSQNEEDLNDDLEENADLENLEEDSNSNSTDDSKENSNNTSKPNSNNSSSNTSKPNSNNNSSNTNKPNSNNSSSNTSKPNSNNSSSNTSKPNSNNNSSNTNKPNDNNSSNTNKPNDNNNNNNDNKPNIANGYNAEMTNYVNSIIRNRYTGTKTSYFDQLLKDLVTGSKSTSQVSSMLEGYQWEENGELELSEVASKSVQVFTVKDKSEIEPKIKRGNYRYWKAQVYYNNGVYTVAILGIEMMDIVINPN